MTYHKDKDGVITLTLDPRKGLTPSASGKMDLLRDAPRGWTEVDAETGLSLSINIGFRR